MTNVATVSGGGASPASASASDPTAIALVPFGIQSFTTSVTESPGDPFIMQAGGQPFSASATLVFNCVPADDGYLRPAGGAPKGTEIELPPGFLGDPQATLKCPAEIFANGSGDPESPDQREFPCPIDTAVGYLDFVYEGGEIVGGRPEPFGGLGSEPRGLGEIPLCGLVPSPGHPAMFRVRRR